MTVNGDFLGFITNENKSIKIKDIQRQNVVYEYDHWEKIISLKMV